MLPFSDWRSLCWDTTRTDTNVKTKIYRYTLLAGHTVQEAEGRKRRKNKALGARLRVDLIVIETAGVYGKSTIALTISEIGRRHTEVMGESREALFLE